MIENQYTKAAQAPPGFDLPKAAVALLGAAEAAGWVAGWRWRAHSGDNPFVTVHVMQPESGAYFQYTWHSRPTGRLRLFGTGTYRIGFGCLWRDALSLRGAMAYMAERPAV